MPSQVEIETDIPADQNELLFNKIQSWAPVRESDLRTAYRVGRALRRIGQLLDSMGQPKALGERFQKLLNQHGVAYGLRYHRQQEPRPYDEEVLLGAFLQMTEKQLIDVEIDPSDVRRVVLEYARRDPSWRSE